MFFLSKHNNLGEYFFKGIFLKNIDKTRNSVANVNWEQAINNGKNLVNIVIEIATTIFNFNLNTYFPKLWPTFVQYVIKYSQNAIISSWYIDTYVLGMSSSDLMI